MIFSVAPLRWVGSQGIGLDPRKGKEQMEAREPGRGRKEQPDGLGGGGTEEHSDSPTPRLEDAGRVRTRGG